MSSQHPDEHQHNREGEGQELSQSETPTAAKGNPAMRQIREKEKKKKKTHDAYWETFTGQYILPLSIICTLNNVQGTTRVTEH